MWFSSNNRDIHYLWFSLVMSVLLLLFWLYSLAAHSMYFFVQCVHVYSSRKVFIQQKQDGYYICLLTSAFSHLVIVGHRFTNNTSRFLVFVCFAYSTIHSAMMWQHCHTALSSDTSAETLNTFKSHLWSLCLLQRSVLFHGIVLINI